MDQRIDRDTINETFIPVPVPLEAPRETSVSSSRPTDAEPSRRERGPVYAVVLGRRF